MISNFQWGFKLGVSRLKLAIVVLFSYYLFKLEMGFPVRKFIYDFAIWYLAYFVFLLLTRRSLFSLCLSVVTLLVFFQASDKKLSLMNAYIIKDDVSFLFHNPLFVLSFAPSGTLLWVLLLGLGGALLFRYEAKAALSFDAKKTLLLISSLFFAIWMPLQDAYVYHQDRPLGTRALLQFFASYRSDFGLSMPEPTSENAHSCCAKALKQDLSLSLDGSKSQKNILFILMESTFDLGRVRQVGYASAFSDMPSFPLRTYVVGGGTWVEEFAVLHGVPPPMYGEHFNAINTLGMGRLAGRIAPALNDVGYKTKTFSITDRAFYGDESMHKSLGIREYLASEDRPVVSDKSVGRADAAILDDVLQKLQDETAPAFVFVTTEVNHSPHEKEYGNKEALGSRFSKKQANILQEYKEREVIFTATMKSFLKGLKQLKRDSVVVLFGDHIPAAINENFTSDDFVEGDKYQTVGLLYSTSGDNFVPIHQVIGCRPKLLQISDLDVVGLRLAHYNSLYINEKLSKIRSDCVARQ